MAVHESKVSVETLRYCRRLIYLRQAEPDLDEPSRTYCEIRLAELDAEIKAKEAERDA